MAYNYLAEKLLPTIKDKVYAPSVKYPQIPLLWKNNFCEAMNRKIKQVGNWRISKLPQLVERLKEIHECQLMDARGALHGRGNFELAPPARILFIPHEAWLGMNKEQRRKWLYNVFRFHLPTTSNSSTDGFLTIPTTSRITKKPGHVKRVRSAKTTTRTIKKPEIPTPYQLTDALRQTD